MESVSYKVLSACAYQIHVLNSKVMVLGVGENWRGSLFRMKPSWVGLLLHYRGTPEDSFSLLHVKSQPEDTVCHLKQAPTRIQPCWPSDTGIWDYRTGKSVHAFQYGIIIFKICKHCTLIKMSKYLNKIFSNEDIEMHNKFMKRCSTLVIIK